jgi:hypothetical protein
MEAISKRTGFTDGFMTQPLVVAQVQGLNYELRWQGVTRRRRRNVERYESWLNPSSFTYPQPDGSVRLQTLSLEESQRIREDFAREFDPETLEHRAIIECRTMQVSSSEPPSTPENPSCTGGGERPS